MIKNVQLEIADHVDDDDDDDDDAHDDAHDDDDDDDDNDDHDAGFPNSMGLISHFVFISHGSD